MDSRVGKFFMSRSRKDWVIDASLFITAIAVSCLYFILNAPQEPLHIFKIAIDDQIPRLPIFIVPYLAFLPWLWGTMGFSFLKHKSFRKLALAVIIINLVAYGFYIFLQTYIPRTPITSSDLFSNILQIVYNNDHQYNCFPSLHSGLSAMIATYFVCTKSKLAWVAIAMAALVVVSTLFTKQHFIVDAISGVTLGIVATWAIFRLGKSI